MTGTKAVSVEYYPFSDYVIVHYRVPRPYKSAQESYCHMLIPKAPGDWDCE